VVALATLNADHALILPRVGYANEMASPAARRDRSAPDPPAFRDRAEAGARLGVLLREVLGDDHPERFRASAPSATDTAAPDEPRPVVLALPRGGVPVAAEVARALRVPLDILLVRKLGHPEAPELGLGAIAEDGAGGAAEPYFDAEMLSRVRLSRDDLAEVVTRERAELARRAAVYVPGRSASARDRRAIELKAGAEGTVGAPGAPNLAGRLVIVVDDGLATGVTARAALRAVLARGARRMILAVPVAAPDAAGAIEKETGEVVTLVTPRRFRSVGEWYTDFGQLTDADVLALLFPGVGLGAPDIGTRTSTS
jgi:predicted phosphoribosyltransferase